MFGDWWIDDMGKWRAAELPGQGTDSALPIGSDMLDQHTAYRQLGLVKALLTPTTITFRWDIWHASPEAIDSMIEFLEIDKQPRRIVLDFFYGGWITETFYAPAAAIERIRQTSLYRSIEFVDTTFIHEQSFDRIERSAPVIKHGFEYLSSVKHLYDMKDEKSFKALYSKLLVYSESRVDGLFIRLHFGGNSAFARMVYGSDQGLAVKPGIVDALPANRHGKTVSPAYSRVLHEREPRLHHVRALFKKDGKEPIWAPYQRLLYPSTLSDGTPVVVCLSEITHDVDIPFLQPDRRVTALG